MPVGRSLLSAIRNKAAFSAKLARALGILALVVCHVSFVGGSTASAQAAGEITFSGAELLGRPTDSSAMITIVPQATIEYYYEYGTSSGVYTGQTDTANAPGGQAHKTVISGLEGNTQYYYRMQYRTPGDSWVARTERSFWTQRAAGTTFTFTITADSHVNIMLGNAGTWTQTMTRVANDNPDFHIDLGDTFAMDNVTTVAGAESAYLYQRQFFDLVGHSASIFVMPGNHEQEEGWHLDDTGDPATSKPVLSTNARKKYYPNPVPGDFYAGNSDPYVHLDGDHLHEDYYAWEWGNALFVVIDPFWYTTSKPFVGTTGGGEDYLGSGDRWDWTLGLEQFNWMKQVLENSDAPYKFVFAHHMVGGSDDYVRGGAAPAHLVEWGGYNEAGTTYEWATRRPGWGDDPIHQIFIDNGVSAFFHGHDHQYAYEVRDGIVYQALPAAGFSGSGFNIYATGVDYCIQALPSPGHLRVTVSPTEATVDYIGTSSGAVNYSYEIEGQTGNVAPVADDQSVSTPEGTPLGITLTATDDNGDSLTYSVVTGPSHGTLSGAGANRTYTPDPGYVGADSFTFRANDGELDSNTATVSITITSGALLGDVNGDGTANSTDAVIVLSCDAGIDTSQYCPMNCGDVNADGSIDSSDALVILSYDADMTVPFPVGQPGCPSTVEPCAGCSP